MDAAGAVGRRLSQCHASVAGSACGRLPGRPHQRHDPPAHLARRPTHRAGGTSPAAGRAGAGLLLTGNLLAPSQGERSALPPGAGLPDPVDPSLPGGHASAGAHPGVPDTHPGARCAGPLRLAEGRAPQQHPRVRQRGHGHLARSPGGERRPDPPREPGSDGGLREQAQ